jgi:hypothetical protein
MTTKALSKNHYSFDELTGLANKNPPYPKRKSTVSDSTKTTKGINRQQAFRGLSDVVEGFYYPNSDNTEKAIVYQKVRNFPLSTSTKLFTQSDPLRAMLLGLPHGEFILHNHLEKTDGSLPKSINKKTIKVENDFSENQIDDDLAEYYERSESPEIIESFLDVVKSMPIINEQYDSIYSDEELDEL